MFQLKISAAIFVVVAALMGFSYYSLSETVTESVVSSETRELSLARRAVADNRRTAGLSLVARVESLSSDQKVVYELNRLRKLATESGGIEEFKRNRDGIFTYLLEWSRAIESDMKARFGEVNTEDSLGLHAGALERPLADWWGARPDIVLAFVATPLKDKPTAHLLAAHAERGQELSGGRSFTGVIPVLSRAEESLSMQVDVIPWLEFEYLVVAAPVSNEEGVQVGTIVVGYQLGAGLVSRIASVNGDSKETIVFSGDRHYAADDEQKSIKDELFKATYNPVDGDNATIDMGTEISFEEMEQHETYLTSLNGHRYLVQRDDWRLAEDDDAAEIGFFVLSDYEAAIAPVDKLTYQIPLVGGILLVVALILTMLIIRSFLRPLEDIDVGIRNMLAGDKDYVFRARPGNPLHGELVNSLNQLTAYLQGKKAPDDAAQEWDELLVDLEPERPSVYGLQAVQVVTSDEEKETLRALYDDYMTKRKELDQHVDMDFDRFCRRIKRNETSLKEKHNCKSIEFSVAVADGKVVLKPTPIFD